MKKTDYLYLKATHMKADLSRLRMFGCRIYALGTKRHFGKLTTINIGKGIFLSYGGTINTFTYQNMATNLICRATHTHFDKVDLNSNPTDLTPNSHALWNAFSHAPGSTLASNDKIASESSPNLLRSSLPSVSRFPSFEILKSWPHP
jgi:hypothetical protein